MFKLGVDGLASDGDATQYAALKECRYDIIVALAMGGFVPAGVLARELVVPIGGAITTQHYVNKCELGKASIVWPRDLTPFALGPLDNPLRVLLVDDILDSGLTLDTVARALKVAGAREVHAAVVLRREGRPIPESLDRLYAFGTIAGDAWVEFPWEREDRLALMGAAEPWRGRP